MGFIQYLHGSNNNQVSLKFESKCFFIKYRIIPKFEEIFSKLKTEHIADSQQLKGDYHKFMDSERDIPDLVARVLQQFKQFEKIGCCAKFSLFGDF